MQIPLVHYALTTPNIYFALKGNYAITGVLSLMILIPWLIGTQADRLSSPLLTAGILAGLVFFTWIAVSLAAESENVMSRSLLSSILLLTGLSVGSLSGSWEGASPLPLQTGVACAGSLHAYSEAAGTSGYLYHLVSPSASCVVIVLMTRLLSAGYHEHSGSKSSIFSAIFRNLSGWSLVIFHWFLITKVFL